MTPLLRTLLRYVAAVAVALAFAAVAELFSRVTGSSRLTAIFLSSVLVSAFFIGPGPGLLTAVVAFLAHLYLVDPPYALSFGSVEEVNGLMLFLASSVLTCLLARGVKLQASAARRQTERTAALLDATRELSATADEPFIRERLAARLALASEGRAYVRDGDQVIWRSMPDAPTPDGEADDDADRAEAISPARWTVRPLVADGAALGEVGWRRRRGRPVPEDQRIGLEILADTGGAAIARARLTSAKAEAETRARTEDLRNALLASISHDLRTPLSAIMASAGSLRRYGEQFDAATREDLAATIEEEVKRLDAFVANLLQMTRLQSGAIVLSDVPFSVEESARAALNRRGQAEQARVSMQGAWGLAEAVGDPTLYEQALGNVLENALRYSARGAPVTVSAGQAGQDLVVTVTDEGPGVADDELELIFEKFFRSPATASRPGTGLGLAIVRGLMEAMGGAVAARNRTDGRPGLVVSLTLPAATS